MEQNERRLWLIKELLRESGEYPGIMIPKDEDGRRQLLRGLMNVRMPEPYPVVSSKSRIDICRRKLKRKGITDVRQLEPLQDKIYLWRGDITTLAVRRHRERRQPRDDGMLSPQPPVHRQLHPHFQRRPAAKRLRRDHGEAGSCGGYRTCKNNRSLQSALQVRCLHTVGPIVHGRLMDRDRELLADCYRSCLELAAEKGLESVAFCCISTGEFHFPNDTAAEIAVRTVKEFMAANRNSPEVIFNVFKEKDYDIYRQMLG